MLLVPIKNIPNQVFSITLNGVGYRIMLRTIQELTFMSVWVNNEALFYNQICTPNNWVNQYNYISVNGKFYFYSLDEEYPNYKKFGVTQALYFLTPEEVNEKA